MDRFVRAQAGKYDAVLAELRAGNKQTHWMWFIFPQILGLGLSANARTYAIRGREEAKAYLDHELLGPRLLECTRAMLDHAGSATPLTILGPIDSLKFRSSMTLFEAVADDPTPFASALDNLCDGGRDKATLEKLD
nr:DUF1810 domain-containing protein [Aurantiacibacter rhizosphaerae]